MLSPGLLEGTCVFCWAGGGDVGSLFCGFVGMVGLGQRLGWMSLDGFPNLSVVPFYDSETFWEEEELQCPPAAGGGGVSPAPISGWVHSTHSLASAGQVTKGWGCFHLHVQICTWSHCKRALKCILKMCQSLASKN